MKEIGPALVATHTEPPAECEGHPFIVEAGVCVGGAEAKEGVSVYRFANRIPLLFEAGNDVVTRTAFRKIQCEAARRTRTRTRSRRPCRKC